MEWHSPTANVYPDEREALASFQSEYGDVLANHVVQHFLSQEFNYQLFITAICFPTKENWERLDQAFRRFYIEIRFINYIAKVIWRYARDFRTKHQRSAAYYLLILDQPITEEESSTTHKDQLADNNENVFHEGKSLLNQVENSFLQESLKQLTDKQLRILNLYYVDHITQKEIGDRLGISQQSVSKTLDAALEKLKDSYEDIYKVHAHYST